MDSFAGTNKSQFFYGGVGLMLSVGLLYCAIVIYMVVGHTKFGPDLVARQIAGLYNSSDAFNHRQPVRMMKPYAIAGAYNESVLLPYWREQEGWMKDYSVQSVNARLAAVEPYKRNPELRKETYGAKSKGIYVQYAKTVPAQCKLSGWESPAEMMAKPVHGQAWDVQTLKEHAKFLANKRMDIFA
eukprot:contig_23025_g5683